MTSPDDVDSHEAVERERRLWAAYQSRNREQLEALIDPDALDVGPGGILSRDQVAEAIERMRIESFTIEDLTVRALGLDVEVVSYRSTVNGTYGGRPFAAPVVNSTSVWSRRCGEWRLVHRAECPVSNR